MSRGRPHGGKRGWVCAEKGVRCDTGEGMGYYSVVLEGNRD